MFNSYTQPFGPVDPNHETSVMFDDMSSEIYHWSLNYIVNGRIDEKKLEAKIREVIDAFFADEESNQTSFSQLDKAVLFEGAVHFANENFFEVEDSSFEDEEALVDSYAAQETFLEVLTKVLKSY